jgi:hypothetical protein
MDVRGLVRRMSVPQRVVVGLVALLVLGYLVVKLSEFALVFLLALGGWIYYRFRQERRQKARAAAARAAEEAERKANERSHQEKTRFTQEAPQPETTDPAWPYEILGVSPSATFEEVRIAYKVLVWRYHPDNNPPGDESARERFMAVQEAYDALGLKR